jgi:hypothetical protein
MSEQQHERGPSRRVGAIWKPRPGSKTKGTGSVTINGLRQRFVILPNDRKSDGSSQPDYNLVSSDAPEIDEFAREKQSAAASGPSRGSRAPESNGDDDIPF